MWVINNKIYIKYILDIYFDVINKDGIGIILLKIIIIFLLYM